jgi:hypothetical protein
LELVDNNPAFGMIFIVFRQPFQQFESDRLDAMIAAEVSSRKTPAHALQNAVLPLSTARSNTEALAQCSRNRNQPILLPAPGDGE